MNRKILFLTLAVFCVLGQFLYAKGNNEKKADEIVISGRVRLVGSGLINDLVITNDEKEWYIEKNESGKLWNLQQQNVTVSGKEYYIDLFFANGSPAGRQYFLKDIRIISVKK